MRKIVFALAIAAMVGCKQKAGLSGDNVTSGGFTYEVKHTNPDGEKIKGDAVEYVDFGMALYTDDGKLIRKTSTGINSPIAKIEKDKEYGKKEFIAESLKNAQAGDSITLKIPIDSLPPQAKMQFPNASNFVYKLYVEDVLSEAEFLDVKAERDAEVAKMREKQQKLQEKFKKNVDTYKARAKSVDKKLKKNIDAYKSNKLKVTTTDSGLKYIVHENGNGAKINNGDVAYVMYYGALVSDKSSFDNSFDRGMPFPVQVGQGRVIKGWDEALVNLKKGDKATLFIPADIAYGASGRPGIPGGSELAFYIEVLED